MFRFALRPSLRAASISASSLFLGATFLLTSALAQPPHAAQPPSRAQIEEMLRGLHRGRSMRQVAVAPDGKRLAWVEGAEIRVAVLDNLAKSEQVTAAASAGEHCQEGQIGWRPDSKALVFFSDCAKPGEQSDLYLARLDGSPVQRLTELNGYADAPAFAPDGKRVAFLYVEGATRPAGALAAMNPPAGLIGEDNVEIERVALAAADAPAPASPVFATPPNLHVFEFDWSPDSRSLAYVAAEPPGENNWWLAKLYTQALGSEARAILAPGEVAGPLHGMHPGS